MGAAAPAMQPVNTQPAMPGGPLRLKEGRTDCGNSCAFHAYFTSKRRFRLTVPKPLR